MTRDEAIEALFKTSKHTSPRTSDSLFREYCSAELDGYIALGMLKIEEPKSAEDRVAEALSGITVGRPHSGYYVLGARDAEHISTMLYNAGLKIVEK